MPKTTFMSNHNNFYYHVMPFDLKKVGATYLEVYVDDMIVKVMEGDSHTNDLEDILQSIRRYDMRLNPFKCSFGVHEGKFTGFMLTRIRIEANLGKFQVVIDMRTPTNMKKV